MGLGYWRAFAAAGGLMLAQITALHLHPAPLTLASFAGIAPQRGSLGGD